MMNRLEELKDLVCGCFWTRLEELVEELEDNGYEVLHADRESVSVGYTEDDEDVEAKLYLCGTENTVTVTSVEEAYRG